jgi:hypothetical protein
MASKELPVPEWLTRAVNIDVPYEDTPDEG